MTYTYTEALRHEVTLNLCDLLRLFSLRAIDSIAFYDIDGYYEDLIIDTYCRKHSPPE